MNDLKLIIFDMDGTLIDSQGVIISAMKLAYSAVGVECPDDEAIRRIIGLSLPEVFATLSPNTPSEMQVGLVEQYKEAFVTLRAAGGAEAHSPLFPGAKGALINAANDEWLLSIATGKARRGLDHAVKTHQLEGVFSFTQTADDAPSKPHPAMVERSIAMHGVSPERAVMVGDTSFDMQMARGAGAKAIGVAWGYHPVQELRQAGAHIVINSFSELKHAVASLVGK
jgi:phosphoglycolate phosphatase